MTSSSPVNICLNHANEKEENIWSTTAVSPVMQDMWYCMCLSSGPIRTAVGWRVSYFTQLVFLGHSINLSSVACLYL